MVKRLFTAMCSAALLGTRVFAFQPPEGQSEFVPMKDVPPTEQLAAGPLLVTAYAFVVVALMFYVWTIARRVNKVEAEMQALARRSSGRSSGP